MTVIVSQEMADAALATIAGVWDAAGPELATWLEIESQALDVAGMVGMNMNEVHDLVLHRAQEQVYLPVMQKAP